MPCPGHCVFCPACVLLPLPCPPTLQAIALTVLLTAGRAHAWARRCGVAQAAGSRTAGTGSAAATAAAANPETVKARRVVDALLTEIALVLQVPRGQCPACAHCAVTVSSSSLARGVSKYRCLCAPSPSSPSPPPLSLPCVVPLGSSGASATCTLLSRERKPLTQRRRQQRRGRTAPPAARCRPRLRRLPRRPPRLAPLPQRPVIEPRCCWPPTASCKGWVRRELRLCVWRPQVVCVAQAPPHHRTCFATTHVPTLAFWHAHGRSLSERVFTPCLPPCVACSWGWGWGGFRASRS